MCVQSRTRWLPAASVAVSAVLLVTASGNPARAQSRQVPVESLIYDLKNPDPPRRQAAVRDLGIAKYAAATLDLVALSRDPDASVRRAVELSLEQMDDIRALSGFVTLCADTEKDIRDRSVQALINLHLPRPTGPTATLTRLGNLVNPLSDEYAVTVIEPDVPLDPSVVRALRDRLTDPDDKIRRNASRGLGILRAEAAIPELAVVVREDRDNEVRFEAVRAIRKISDRSVGDRLVPLINLNNDKVRNEIISTLGTLRYREAVPELARIFEQARSSERVRSLALAAMADIADPASRPLFLRLKADKDEAIRLYANEGLARVGGVTPTDLSGDRLAEKSARVQTAQAFGLLRMGQVEYLDELIRALGSSSTRELAREYLLEMPPSERASLFAKRPEKSAVRAELADVFGLTGDAAALPAVQELSHDTDAGVARMAERAIRRINAVHVE